MVEPLTGKREHMPPGNGHASERQAYLDEDALVSAAASGLLPSPRASSKTGYLGVCFHSGAHHHKPYAAHVQRGGKVVRLGTFATAEEAALVVASTPEGQAAAAAAAAAAAERVAATPPLTSEEARQQAQAEGLTLRVGRSGRGYFGVNLPNPGKPKPYQAQVTRGGKQVRLGYFFTA